MNKEDLIKVTSRSIGSVSYALPELGIGSRNFEPRETKEISFKELEALSWIPGGIELLKHHLVIKNEEALKLLLPEVEPEYFYTEEDVEKILISGSMNEFLDLLDFAPDGVLNIVKSLAVSLPVKDTDKRDAILDKLGFNVTKAIEIQNTKFDGGDEDNANSTDKPQRRTEIPKTTTVPQRRVAIPIEK